MDAIACTCVQVLVDDKTADYMETDSKEHFKLLGNNDLETVGNFPHFQGWKNIAANKNFR